MWCGVVWCGVVWCGVVCGTVVNVVVANVIAVVTEAQRAYQDMGQLRRLRLGHFI